MSRLHFYADKSRIFELNIHEPSGPGLKNEVPEILVQEIWRLQLFNRTDLKTSCGKSLQIVKTGRHNHDQGPDFKNAELIIDGEILFGDVEIHNQEIDWILHRHQVDPAYNEVILHVLLYSETEMTPEILKENGQSMPNLILADRLKKPIKSLLFDFRNQSRSPFPCRASWADVPDSLKTSLVQKRASDRFNRRVSNFRDQLHGAVHRDEVLYRGILRVLGYSKNSEAMMEISTYLSLEELRGQKDVFDRLALLLGITGLFATPSRVGRMPRSEAKSQIELRSRFDSTSRRSEFRPTAWVNHRLRPQNRPDQRIVQLAFLCSEGRLLGGDSYELLREEMLQGSPKISRLLSKQFVETDDAWKDLLYRKSGIGEKRKSTLLANVVIPWACAVAEVEGDFRVLNLFESSYAKLRDQNDSVTRPFLDSASKEISRLTGEGIRELYHNWCAEGKCLSCDAGQHLLKRSSTRNDL